MAADPAVIEDACLSPLLEEGFEAKSFAAATMQNQMVGDTLQKLAIGIAALDKELYSQVVTNYEDLLSQATGIEALEGVLKMMHTRIESLRTAVDRIGSKVIDPYQVIVSRTRQLSRLQNVCDLLRKVIRMLYLLKRLKSQLQGGTREITKVAQTFSEIDQLSGSGDLSGVVILEEEGVWLARARREVESQAKKMLMQGLELMNSSQVGVALQVFHNLTQLPSSLLTILTGYKEAIQHDIQNSLDPSSLVLSSNGSGPGRASLPLVGTTASWKAVLWTRLDQLVVSVQKAYGQVHQLHTVLVKKRDPHTQVSFLDNINGTPAHHLLTNFWEVITEDLGVELVAAAKASIVMNQAFETDYPKLVKIFSELLVRIEQFATPETPPSSLYNINPPSSSSSSGGQTGSTYEAALLKALSPFEKSYVSRSLSRLFDSVNQLFVPGARATPTKDTLQSTIRTITSELGAAGSSRALAGVIARNVEKTMQLFNMKCEQALMTGRDAVQVSGPPNAAQLKNIGIANSLFAFSTLVSQHILSLSTLPPNAHRIISSALEGTMAQMCSVVSLFVGEVQRVMEEIVVSMHQENFGSELMAVSGTPDQPCSGYLRELQAFTARIHSQHLSLYHCTAEVEKQLREVSERVLELFVRHVCLLRPLREGGKMRVTTDMAQIELALTPFCSRPGELGRPYLMLRTLR
ncbi:Conserved oligomeric Golgi complex subunit 5 [Geodia barretti]|nr:Conserved oligomeric Golgi complex subunit 5 [Geodia barretti]